MLHHEMNSLLPTLKAHDRTLADSRVTPRRFAGLIKMLEKDEINSTSAKSVLKKLFETDGTPEEIVDKIISDNASAVENYKNGNKKSIGFLVGQAMRISHMARPIPNSSRKLSGSSLDDKKVEEFWGCAQPHHK